MSRSSYGQSAGYMLLSAVYFAVLAVGSSLVLIVVNALLIRGLWRLNTRRSSMLTSRERVDRLRREDAHLTRMLIVVVFVFLAGELPSASVSRLLHVDVFGDGSECSEQSTSYRAALLVAYTLVVAQHSLNFVVYCLMNKSFVEALRCLLCATLCGNCSWTQSCYHNNTNQRPPPSPIAMTTANRGSPRLELPASQNCALCQPANDITDV
jgi:cytochrome b561